ncbi:hypothetical protein MRX96_029111 [Rhipicephalus microplus]
MRTGPGLRPVVPALSRPRDRACGAVPTYLKKVTGSQACRTQTASSSRREREGNVVFEECPRAVDTPNLCNETCTVARDIGKRGLGDLYQLLEENHPCVTLQPLARPDCAPTLAAFMPHDCINGQACCVLIKTGFQCAELARRGLRSADATKAKEGERPVKPGERTGSVFLIFSPCILPEHRR